MTLKELRDKINQLLSHNYKDEVRVVVATARSGIPSQYKTDVKSISLGFDWERGLCIISTEDLLVPIKKLTGTLKEAAEARLHSLEGSYNKLGFNYGIKKSQRQAWLEGYIEGVKSQFTEIDSTSNPSKEEDSHEVEGRLDR